MQEIEDFNHALKKQRKTSTVLVGGLLTIGLGLTIPLWNDSIKWGEILYCYQKSNKPCQQTQYKRGISWLVKKEVERNAIFSSKVQIITELEPEDSTAILFGLTGSVVLFAAYIASKILTDAQEKALHSQFLQIKNKALENDILLANHLDLTQFSKAKQSEITKAAISRNAYEIIEAMKSEGELQLDEINGKLQGELAIKTHELQLSELDKQIADNNLTTAETTKKLHKISKVFDGDTDTKILANEQLKNILIDALKHHEDGWLWKIIDNLKPLWLIGNQGSGKTYTATAIALIRKYCLDAPIYQLIDRHATGDNADVWKYLDATIKAESEEEINQGFDDCCDRWLARIKQKPKTKQQVIVDEYTNLQSLCGDSAVMFFKMSLSDNRKAKEYLLGITHNATNETFPPKTLDARKSGTILLQKFSANNETPLARVVVRYGLVDEDGNNLEDIERIIPDWLHPEKIYNHFNGKPIKF